MTLGTNLTAKEYLAVHTKSEEWGRARKATKAEVLSHHKEFKHIMNSSLETEKATHLTASDYFKNPVKNKSIKSVLEPGLDASSKFNVKDPNHQQAQGEVSDGSAAASKEDLKFQTQKSDDKVLDAIKQSVTRAAEKYQLSRDLILGVIRAESGFKADAVSSAGARGLMQLMPATARELGVEDSFDIDQNIDGGARYLRNMLDRFDNDIEKALSAYNAGPGTVERYGGKVPYRETQQYVTRVLKFSGLKV